ncbi:SCP2 sterol-binding domain-containing protein [Azohydromonas sp.]|uniref:ubiquinone anaerobic biosynthesis accessory factor UbiT n=1 Tax=Azohydromonas sp. TaxID=1872666 RepID=UPI002CEDA36B|nr:SCP2 sterol-binding domain-containing protein [Azohydromonas sp.]HMM86525.1 SCP2 sterol-binding domain-containing protein [Azohydromonas sp.]
MNTTTPPADLYAGLPAPLARAARHVRGVVRRLPTQPPSFVAARALDLALWPRLDAEQRRLLAQRTVEVEVLELGVRVRLRLGARGFEVAPSRDAPALVIRARADALWRLVRGEDDADRLFFERALVMEGDTEYGLVLKNTLDAIGPLWQ